MSWILKRIEFLTPEQRSRIKWLSNFAHHSVKVGQAEEERAKHLETLGFKPFDASHIACAESRNVNVFLTTDDRLLRLATRISAQLRVRVENPLTWLKEVIENESANDLESD